MALFKKKKINIEEKEHDYTKMSNEFEFLMLILTRKKNITKEFVINVYTTQQSDGDYLRDEDIEDTISKIVNEVINEIGENYKKFLIKHYFGTLENLIKFISEDVYVDLVDDAINRNNKKSVNILTKKATNIISKLNNK